MPPTTSTKRQQQPESDAVSRPKRPRVEPPPEPHSTGRATGTEIQNRPATDNTSQLQSDEICSGCRNIDFDDIFRDFVDSENMCPKKRRRVWRFPLLHISPESTCILCQFFYQMPRPDLTWASPLELRVVRAKAVFSAQQTGLADSPVFVVGNPKVLVGPGAGRFFSYQHDAASIIMAHSNAPDTLSARQLQPEVDLAVLAEWLRFCQDNHKDCNQLQQSIPEGFRVLDCSTRTILHWEDVAVADRHYVALSYVWGKVQASGAGNSRPPSMVPCSLPRTIEDAIALTRGLGYRYLWVDRYCIPQDNAKTKHSQLQNMDAIYHHAVLTIIAAAGDDSYYGLPGIGRTPRNAQRCVRVGSRTLVSTPCHVRDEISNSKWNSRGWTYQEGMLAKRRLVFTDTQAYFQCNAMHCLESIQAPLEHLHTSNKTRMRDRVDMSRVFPHRTLGKTPASLDARVSEYLTRSLTFESDIHDAFRGILAAYERKFSSSMRILAGLRIRKVKVGEPFLDALGSALSWHLRPFWDYQCISTKLQRRPGFPSWTWLGWARSETLESAFFAPLEFMNMLIDASMEYDDGLLLPWVDNSDLIFSRDSTGSFPRFIRIRGLTLDILISAGGNVTNKDGLIDEHHDAWRRAVAYTRRTYVVSKPHDAALPFTLFVLGYKYDITFLLLYQPEGSLFFERVDILHSNKFQGGLGRRISYNQIVNQWTNREVRIG